MPLRLLPLNFETLCPGIRVEARLDNHFPFESAHFFDGGFERYRNIIGVVQLTVDIVHDGYWLGDVFQQKAVHPLCS